MRSVVASAGFKLCPGPHVITRTLVSKAIVSGFFNGVDRVVLSLTVGSRLKLKKLCIIFFPSLSFCSVLFSLVDLERY